MPYDDNGYLYRDPVIHPAGGRVMVKKADQQSTDINEIVRRARAGQMPRLNARQPLWGDFSEGSDFFHQLTRVRSAESAFMDLPPNIRRHCNGDPGEFLNMVYDPDRRDELVELGLVPELAPAAVTTEKDGQLSFVPNPKKEEAPKEGETPPK